MPIKRFIITILSDEVEPTAASARLPVQRPTTMMSIALNSSCSMPESMSGAEKIISFLSSGPLHISISYLLMKLPPFPEQVPQQCDHDGTTKKTVKENNNLRISTGVLNDVLIEAMAMQQPPSDKGKQLRIYYITQASVKPPTFVLFVNDRQLMHFSYRRYLENQMRDAFGFVGTPIHFVVRERKENS